MLSLAVWIQYKSVAFVTVNLLIEHFEMSVYYYIIIKSVMDRQTDRQTPYDGIMASTVLTYREHKYHAIKQRKNTINQHNHKLSSACALWRRSPCHI